MRRGMDIAGKKFGRLTAVAQIANPKGTGALWKFLCECGSEKVIKGQGVRLGLVVSCGCYNKEIAAKAKTTHGLSSHSLFKTWEGMVSRCSNPTNKDWLLYGGRGIKVCDAWLKSPDQFIADIGIRPNGATLDRKDNSKDYDPENCRWATPLEQGGNKRNNKLITHDGRTQHLAAWARELGEPESTIFNRMKVGRAIDDRVRRRRTAPLKNEAT